MEIRPYKQITESEFSSSLYTKQTIVENENGKAIWGHASIGQEINESCIWIKRNDETQYKSFIIETRINLGNSEDMTELKLTCQKLLNSFKSE